MCTNPAVGAGNVPREATLDTSLTLTHAREWVVAAAPDSPCGAPSPRTRPPLGTPDAHAGLPHPAPDPPSTPDPPTTIRQLPHPTLDRLQQLPRAHQRLGRAQLRRQEAIRSRTRNPFAHGRPRGGGPGRRPPRRTQVEHRDDLGAALHRRHAPAVSPAAPARDCHHILRRHPSGPTGTASLIDPPVWRRAPDAPRAPPPEWPCPGAAGPGRARRNRPR